ncbi:PDC sensor domain-containing protein [Thermococcus peptonophilus]|uniref:PDC sensor domain-containing protein n=1 Tax=Thermococcus peptonophilus TaxID=53952 RepID=UPI000B098396
MSDMEFKKKIVGIVVVALLLVTVLASAMIFYTGSHTSAVIKDKMQPVVEDQAREAVMAKAESLAEQFSGFFDSVEALGRATKELTIISLNDLQSEGVSFGDPGYAEKLRPILLEHFEVITKAEPKLSAVYFGDVNGNMFIYPEQELPPDYDPRVRPWYQKAVQVNGPTWSEPYEDASSGKWVITYAIPVYYNGKLVGVIGLDVFIDELTKTIDTVKIGQTGYAYVVGQDGTIYMHPNHDYIMKLNVFKEPSLKSVADIIRSGKDKDVAIYTFNGGVTAVAAGVKIPNTGWYVFAKVPVSEISAPTLNVIEDTRQATKKSALMTAILILALSVAMIGVAYKLIDSSLKPLVALSVAAQALAEGRLSEVREKLKQIQYLEDDEIGGVLIKAFEAVGKDVVGTLQGIAEKLERLAEGDLSNGLSVEAKGELREIIEDVKDMSTKMRELLGNIVGLTEKLEKHANVLAQIASDVTEAINQVNEAVQQVSVEAQRQQENINEITEGMRLVADMSEESVRAMEEFEGGSERGCEHC